MYIYLFDAIVTPCQTSTYEISQVTSAKMHYLRHRLRIFLFHRKVIFRFQDIQVFVFLAIP